MVEFKAFGIGELEAFLAAVDRHLCEPATIQVVGGSAIALAYRVGAGTHDIDLWDPPQPALVGAIKEAKRETGLEVPVNHAPVSDAPYNYAERLVRACPDLKNLTVLCLEKHDLALSKAVRGLRNDLDAVAALHAADPLDEKTLVDRYCAEMDHAIGQTRDRDWKFARLVDRLFGEMAYENALRRLQLG